MAEQIHEFDTIRRLTPDLPGRESYLTVVPDLPLDIEPVESLAQRRIAEARSRTLGWRAAREQLGARRQDGSASQELGTYDAYLERQAEWHTNNVQPGD